MKRTRSRFSDLTLIEAVNLYRHLTQAQFEQRLLYFSLGEEILPRTGLSVDNKANALTNFVIENSSHQTAKGEGLDEGIIKGTVEVPSHYSRSALTRALARDGYSLDDEGSLIRDLPPIADLPETKDELLSLLDEIGLSVARGHLDQAIKNHADGHWAAANSQMRSFLEDIFNQISKRLEPAKADEPLTSENRRARLAKTHPPFLSESLSEWSNDGKNFVNGLFKRLHAEGSHPGLSGDADCTFRLHLVLIVGHHYLQRAKNRLTAH